MAFEKGPAGKVWDNLGSANRESFKEEDAEILVNTEDKLLKKILELNKSLGIYAASVSEVVFKVESYKAKFAIWKERHKY